MHSPDMILQLRQRCVKAFIARRVRARDDNRDTATKDRHKVVTLRMVQGVADKILSLILSFSRMNRPPEV